MKNKRHPSTFDLSTAQLKKLEEDLTLYLTGKGWTIEKRHLPVVYSEDCTISLDNHEKMTIFDPLDHIIATTFDDYAGHLLAAASVELIAEQGDWFDCRIYLTKLGYTFKSPFEHDSLEFIGYVYDPTGVQVAANRNTTMWKENALVGELLVWEKFVNVEKK